MLNMKKNVYVTKPFLPFIFTYIFIFVKFGEVKNLQIMDCF